MNRHSATATSIAHDAINGEKLSRARGQASVAFSLFGAALYCNYTLHPSCPLACIRDCLCGGNCCCCSCFCRCYRCRFSAQALVCVASPCGASPWRNPPALPPVTEDQSARLALRVIPTYLSSRFRSLTAFQPVRLTLGPSAFTTANCLVVAIAVLPH